MPTIITHGVVALALAAKARGIQVLSRKRLLLTCIACAILPDIDYFGLKMSVQYNSLFGHRGFTHSFFFAAIVGLLFGWLFNRRAKGSPANYAKLFLLFFVVTASHPILDAMTDGGEGVAFFSPFSNHRYFFPYRPIMVSPLGIEAFFRSWRGLVVLVNELVLVIIPLWIVLYFPELRKKAKARWLLALLLLTGWASSVAVLNGLSPLNNIFLSISNTGHPVIDLFEKQYNDPRILNAIPLGQKPFVTNFLELQKLGLFNSRIEAVNMESHWASGFFPNWYGGIGGRWQDSNLSLILRTFFGFGVASSQEIQEILKQSTQSPAKRDFLFRLSPAEKYDLALGDYNFAATKSVLSDTHNAGSMPHYWYGICNGMAAAAKWHQEPYRAVDAINPNGFKIRFHPNDVKALLGFAFAEVSNWYRIGILCKANGPEALGCRVNPGIFFLATMNRIALNRDSFIVDGFSGVRKQFYLFDAVRVEVLERPKPAEEWKGWAIPTPAKHLAKVRFTMDLVSTLLSDKEGGRPDEANAGDEHFKKVGRVAVPRVLEAVIALDWHGEVIGGAWLGEEDVPDIIYFPASLPSMDNQGRLKTNPAFNWSVVKRIYEKSIDGSKDRAAVDFSL